MEKNHHTLRKAIEKLPDYEPDEQVWSSISTDLGEKPLKAALKELPEYEPDRQLWELISRKAATKKSDFMWWYAAAMLLVGLSIGILVYEKNPRPNISYSVEKVDTRLQNEPDRVADAQYERLKAYCETETLVCNSKDYRRLQQEYEKLQGASVQLQQAIGEYNTEAELIRQFSILEEQKADILNKMAKMI